MENGLAFQARHRLLLVVVVWGLCGVCMLPARSISQGQDLESTFRLALALEQGGEFERAAGLYAELVQRAPDNYTFFDGLQRTWMQLKKYDDVTLLISNRLARNPGDITLRSLMGSVLYRAGKETAAAAAWDSAIAAAPKNPATYRLVASVLTENRLLDRAADVYRRGRTATGDENLFSLELAGLLSAEMDYAGATGEYLRWLQRSPTQLAFVQGRMTQWVPRDDARNAAIGVVRTFLNDHEDLPLLELLAWLSMEGKNFDAALDVYRRIDNITHAQGSAISRFAERALQEKAFEVAARAFQEAINVPLPPLRLPYALYGYATALKEQSALIDTLATPFRGAPATESQPLYGGAIARFRKIIEEYPRSEFSAKSYYQIGMIQFEKFADLDGALASFGHVLEEVQVVTVLRYDVGLMIGRVYLVRGDSVHAAERFNAVAAAPDALPDQSDEAIFHLAEIDYFGGHFDAAVAKLDGIAVNPKADYANDALRLQAFLQENTTVAPEALRSCAKADFLARQGKNTEAILILLAVITAYPQAPCVDDALMNVASLQASAGLTTEAIGSYERLLTQFKESSISLDRAQFRLAEAWQYGMRDKGKAIASYEKLLSDYPSSVLVTLARKRIRQLRGDSI